MPQFAAGIEVGVIVSAKIGAKSVPQLVQSWGHNGVNLVPKLVSKLVLKLALKLVPN